MANPCGLLVWDVAAIRLSLNHNALVVVIQHGSLNATVWVGFIPRANPLCDINVIL
jgi:hypothetical protein